MSSAHGASRRQSYGRRQKELRARRRGELAVDLVGPAGWSRGPDWEPQPRSPLPVGLAASALAGRDAR
jgi:hypothetical protein